MQLPDTLQKEHLCPYNWEVRSQARLNITKDTGGGGDGAGKVSRWCGFTGWSASHRGKHSQHLLLLFLGIHPLSSGFHEESFFHLWHLFFLNKLNLESHVHY